MIKFIKKRGWFFFYSIVVSFVAAPAFTQTPTPAWLTPSGDPEITACQKSALFIKIGMDDRREGLTESQSLSRWNGILLDKRASSSDIAQMIISIKLSYLYKNIDYSAPENFYYNCLLGMAKR